MQSSTQMSRRRTVHTNGSDAACLPLLHSLQIGMQAGDTECGDRVFQMVPREWETWLRSADAYVSQFLTWSSKSFDTTVIDIFEVDDYFSFMDLYGEQLDIPGAWKPRYHPILDIMLNIERAFESSETILSTCTDALNKYNQSTATT